MSCHLPGSQCEGFCANAGEWVVWGGVILRDHGEELSDDENGGGVQLLGEAFS